MTGSVPAFTTARFVLSEALLRRPMSWSAAAEVSAAVQAGYERPPAPLHEAAVVRTRAEAISANERPVKTRRREPA